MRFLYFSLYFKKFLNYEIQKVGKLYSSKRLENTSATKLQCSNKYEDGFLMPD